MDKKVDIDLNNTRLDKWLFKEGLVNNIVQAQKLIRKKQIKINRNNTKINDRVHTDDIISYPALEIEKKKTLKEKYKPTKQDQEILLNSILYKDKNIIIINKPSGLSVQGGSNSYKNLDSMLELLKFGNKANPRLVHRLDKQTSGALIIARNNQTAIKLTEMFKKHLIKKTYRAIVLGHPKKKTGIINAPLLKQSGNYEKVIVSENGKEAITKYKLLKKYENSSLLELELETGRMHQIRVHLQYIGHPIVGDSKYGGKKTFLKDYKQTLHLHSYKVSLPDIDNSNNIISVTAKEPDYFAN